MKTKTFQKEITTADGEKVMLERTTDDAADAVTLLAQGWAEKTQATLPEPPRQHQAPTQQLKTVTKENTKCPTRSPLP